MDIPLVRADETHNLASSLDKYPEYQVEDNEVEAIEQMGSKPKFWFSPTSKLEERWLYKSARPGTGDDWSERIAAELALLLGLPRAQVELGIHAHGMGTISRKFNPKGSTLVHGNEILSELNPKYPPQEENIKKALRVKEHTLDAIFQAFAQLEVGLPTDWSPLAGIRSAADMFTGYLLLDAWIGNTDRHHENWACVRLADGTRMIAPTYDHAASMGALLREEERARRLATKDNNYTVEAFAGKALSALYATPGDARPMLTLDAFRLATQSCPAAARVWLDRLAAVTRKAVIEVISRVPEQRMTINSRLFAQKLLEGNQTKLLTLKEELT